MLSQGSLKLHSTTFRTMSPVPLSPISKMSHSMRTASHDLTSDGIRKRVCKACDRCRLKKSKCDGLSPCTRCKADNAICVFGERKKSHDKVYPKGYVEMLEQQQGQLVAGLQDMYKRLQSVQGWTGPALPEANGHPLTHDILAALNLLESKHDGSGEPEVFEEDCHSLQSRLLADGASYVQRRGSSSSDSDHSQHGQHPSRSTSHGTPRMAKAPVFKNNFNFSLASSPAPQSPAPRQRQSYPPTQPSPLQQDSPLPNDPQLFQAEWSIPDMSSPEQIMRSNYAMQTPDMQQGLSDIENIFSNNLFDASALSYEANFAGMPMTSYPQQLSNAFGGSMQSMQDFGPGLDPTNDVEFSKFIQVTT